MKKFLPLIIIIISVFVLNSCSIIPTNKVTINVYNWEGLIADGLDNALETYRPPMDVNKEFTKRTGIEVNYTTFSNNEELYAKLSSNGAVYDVIVPSDYMVSKLISENMLHKLDFSEIYNAIYIDDKFKKPNYDPKGEYSVPYFWGCTGIFYNKNVIKEEPSDWSELWNEKYKGNILMFDNPRDAFSVSQFVLGLDVNSTSISDWEQAANLLEKQKTLVQSYAMDQILDKMDNGEAVIAPYYGGEAKALLSNPSLGFTIPKNGTNLYIDAMCIPANSPHVKEAMQYINFMCDPEIAFANASKTGYSSPMSCVRDMFDDDIANDPILYPDNETLKNAQTFSTLPDDINTNLDKLWINVKADADKANPVVLIITLVAFVLVYIFILIYKKYKRRKN